MVEFLLNQVPCSGGFGLGVDENGRVIQMAADVSNGLIVSAAGFCDFEQCCCTPELSEC